MRTGSALSRPAVGLCVAAAVALVSPAQAGEPTAANPLPRPHLSIDPLGPSIGMFGLNPDDVYGVGGDGPPADLVFPGAGLGLGAPGDNLDGLSHGNSGVGLADTFVLLFSVDRDTVGAVPPDGSISGTFPFNVQDQANRNQAAGDEYMGLSLFNRQGLAAPVIMNNTLVGNQGDVGGVDHELIPDVDPFQNIPAPRGESIDDLDAHFRLVEGQAVYFTTANGSPSLPDGSTIVVDPDPTTGGTEQPYAFGSQIGLRDGDDIDGLIIFDDGDDLFDPFADQIVFSLSRDSPSLGLLGVSAADVLTTVPGSPGVIQVLVPALALGLDPLLDNINSLDFALSDDIDQAIQDYAISPMPSAAVLALVVLGVPRRRR